MLIKRAYYKWWTWRLNRSMEMLVLGHSGARVLVFPTRGGRFYEYEEMRMPVALREKIEQGHLQFFCIDGIDGETFYNWNAHPEERIQRHIRYEEYILEEVLPFTKALNPDPCLISHGCSLGAFNAANIAFRHPHLFQKLAAFSGRYDLTMKVEGFENLFSGHYSENVYYHTPTHFLPNLHDEKILSHIRNMDIVMTIGKEDPFRDNNENLSTILGSKGIDHQLYHWDDRAHSGHYWRNMAKIYI